MKTKKITILSFLVCLLIIGGSTKSYSQCSYVTSGTSKDTTISIPCDFPVFENTSNPSSDTATFKSAVAKWDSAHSTLKFISTQPGPVVDKTSIEIPESEFAKFSSGRQTAIQRFKYYYKIKN